MACSLIDSFGRRVRYLRLSATDRCDLRCVSCMSEDMVFLSRKDLLSLEEIDRLAQAFSGAASTKSGLPEASRWCEREF